MGYRIFIFVTMVILYLVVSNVVTLALLGFKGVRKDYKSLKNSVLFKDDDFIRDISYDNRYDLKHNTVILDYPCKILFLDCLTIGSPYYVYWYFKFKRLFTKNFEL